MTTCEQADCDKKCGEHEMHKQSVGRTLGFYGILIIACLGWFLYAAGALSGQVAEVKKEAATHEKIDAQYHEKVNHLDEFVVEQKVVNRQVIEGLDALKEIVIRIEERIQPR